MPDTPSASILIVDDEPAQMVALCNTLQDCGYLTAGFTEGSAAIDALRQQRFDLLLADLMMPGMDGIVLLQEALKIDVHLVGIIMTGEGTIATAVGAMKAGALDYILKPFKLSAIVPVLARALAVRRLRVENAALEHRVRERTDELEAANQELEAFSYSVSHDLRSPLRAISGFSAILEEDFSAHLPPDALRLLHLVADNVGRMDQLIEGLLRLSRLGRQSLSKQIVDMSGLAGEVLDELRKEQPDRPVDVRLGDLPARVGDRALLRQVFVNLLSNAFKFTRHCDQPIVEVGIEHRGEEQVYFVRDNGAGFDMRYAAKLFRAFQRLHRADEYEGSGIGLSIAHRIVHRHGGRIWAESEDGRGAAFYFTLSE